MVRLLLMVKFDGLSHTDTLDLDPVNVAEDLVLDGFDMSRWHEVGPAIESAEWLS